MTLLNPAALTLLLLILLLIFRRQRQSRVRMPVSNLYLWKEAAAADTTALTRRVRRHWLLLLQIGVLAATAGALAHPVLIDDAAPVAVVVDASLSMGARHGDGTRADLARTQAVAVLSALPSRTRVRVIAAGASPVAVGEFRAADGALEAAIQNLAVTDTAADLRLAIDYARAEDPQPRRIYVFSDADATAVEGAADADVEWIPIGDPSDNAGITRFSARPGLPIAPNGFGRAESADAMELLVRVVNFGAAIDRATLSVVRDGSAIARQDISLSAKGQATLSFLVPPTPGVLTATLEHDDALVADNHRMLVVDEPRALNVLLTLAADTPTPPAAAPRGGFLEKALLAHPDVVLVPEPDGAYDIVVCSGCYELPPGNRNVLLVAPAAGASGPAVPILTVDPGHPIANGLDLDGVTGMVQANNTVEANSTVIAQAGGMPAILARESGGRRVIEVRVDVDNGPFPFSAAFPVLIANALEWLTDDASPGGRSPGAGGAPELTAGEPLRVRLGPQQTTPQLVGPVGIAVDSTFSEGLLSSTATAWAGLYRVRTDARERILAINPAVEGESNLSVPTVRSRPVTAGTAAPRQATTDASTLLSIAALALLLLEWQYRTYGPPRTPKRWWRRWLPRSARQPAGAQ